MQKRCVWIVGHDSPRFDDERVEFYKITFKYVNLQLYLQLQISPHLKSVSDVAKESEFVVGYD